MRFQRSMLSIGLVLTVTGLVSACDPGEGGGQKTKGHIESVAGSLTGDAKLKRDGKKDEVVGGVKDTVGDIKDAVKDASK